MEVVAQLKIGDSKQFDRTITIQDRLAALSETSRGGVVSGSYTKCQQRNVTLDLDVLMVIIRKPLESPT